MFQPNPTFQTRTGSVVTQAELDVGLRAHMLRVYNYMASALALTGIVAIFFAQTGLYRVIFGTPLAWVVMLAPLAFIFVLAWRFERMSLFSVQALFWAFAAVFGMSMSLAFAVFTGVSIARAFFATAALFGAMSLYGYTTKADLSKMGAFLIMGAVGIMIASLINLFVGSSVMATVISILVVLVFTGLTAWDTQRIKEEYLANFDEVTTQKLAVMGAFGLYLNFINIFQALLNLTGERE